MSRKVLPFPRRPVPESEAVVAIQNRIEMQIGSQRYALEIAAQAIALPPAPAWPQKAAPGTLVETKLVRLRKPVAIGECVDGWQVCWLGGWDERKTFFIAVVERVVRLRQ
jgi:hypothetical protein